MTLPSMRTAVLIAVMLVAEISFAAEWHVKVDGEKSNVGTAESPWDLATALAHPNAVKPGDIIWVHGGTYVSRQGQFHASLKGTARAPIKVYARSNARVILGSKLLIGQKWHDAAHAWFRGLEINSSLKERKQGETTGLSISSSIKEITTPGIRIINCIVHDSGRNGIGYWAGAGDSEIHGCLIYYNGFDTGRGGGHGIYIQNRDKPKLIKNNIIFRNLGIGSQIWGTDKVERRNITYEGNTFFNNGELSLAGGMQHSVWMSPTVNTKFVNNCSYAPEGKHRQYVNFHNGTKLLAENNYLCAPGPRALAAWSMEGGKDLTVRNNTFFGIISVDGKFTDVRSFNARYGGGNVHLTERPTGIKSFVRKNDYESGRANITIYNWDRKNEVEVDISKTGLKNNDPYEIRDVQDFFGKPVIAGTYDGKSVNIPMAGLTVVSPIGLPSKYKTPPHTAPEFGVFVVLKK